MRVRWTTDAASDLEQITERIAKHRPQPCPYIKLTHYPAGLEFQPGGR